MKPYRFVAALAVLTAGCSSAWPPSNQQSGQRLPADTDAYVPSVNHGAARADCTSKPPVQLCQQSGVRAERPLRRSSMRITVAGPN
jgi:hypothetical protein